MTANVNDAGQPVGCPVTGWTTRTRPPRTPMAGRYCRVEPLDVARHAGDLCEANAEDETGRNWTYLAIDAPPTLDAYRAWLTQMTAGDDPFFHAIVDAATNRAIGVATWQNSMPAIDFVRREGADSNRRRRICVGRARSAETGQQIGL